MDNKKTFNVILSWLAKKVLTKDYQIISSLWPVFVSAKTAYGHFLICLKFARPTFYKPATIR